MFDYGEIAESYALGLIPGYSFYEIYKTRDLPSNEEFIGGLGALLTHAAIGVRMQRTGLLARAGLVLTTGGETLAELRMLFPRTFAVASRVLPVATLGLAAAYGQGVRTAMTDVSNMYADAGMINIGHGQRSGWSQIKSGALRRR